MILLLLLGCSDPSAAARKGAQDWIGPTGKVLGCVPVLLYATDSPHDCDVMDDAGIVVRLYCDGTGCVAK